MSTCKHKWEKEPFAGSLKCLKCDYVEFDVAGECLSLQAKVEAMQAAIAGAVSCYDHGWSISGHFQKLKKFLPEEE